MTDRCQYNDMCDEEATHHVYLLRPEGFLMCAKHARKVCP